MLISLALIGIAFYWLLKETDYLRIRLPVGQIKPKYARYAVFNVLKANRKLAYSQHADFNGGNVPDGIQSQADYVITLSPGIDNVLTGWEWLNKHCADLVGYEPEVKLNFGGLIRYTMHIKDLSVIKDIMKANKFSKKQLKLFEA